MSDITRILQQIEAGDASSTGQLLPLVYDELRKLAADRLANEKPGQTLQATALVHEAYLRLVGPTDQDRWQGRGHFFAAAAEAMRRILVEQARRKSRVKHGGDRQRVDLDDFEIEFEPPRRRRDDLLALDAALQKLSQIDGTAAELVQLRYFTGLTVADAAEMMNISLSTGERLWRYARAWLHQEMEGDEKDTQISEGDSR